MVGGAVFSLPAAAQSTDGSHSLTHMVSVTVPARVKVKVSALSMMGSQQVSSAVKVNAAPRSNGLALTVHANKAWVLTVKSSTAADTLVAAGSGAAAPVETAVVFSDAPQSGDGQAVVLTVATP